MLPGPMRNGRPQAPLKVGMSVVKATTVVGSPSKPVKCSAGVCRTSRASARPATAADTASRMADGAEHNLRRGMVGNDVGRAAAADGADIQRAAAKQGIFRQRNLSNIVKDIKQRVNGGVAKLGIGGVREFPVGHDLVAQRAFRTESEPVFGGLAVDQKS